MRSATWVAHFIFRCFFFDGELEDGQLNFRNLGKMVLKESTVYLFTL